MKYFKSKLKIVLKNLWKNSLNQNISISLVYLSMLLPNTHPLEYSKHFGSSNIQ